MKSLRNHLSYANVMATLGVFLALGMGGAYAAQQLIGSDDIEKNAVLSKHIKKDQVKTSDIKDNKGVKSIDIADGTVAAVDLGAGVVGAVAIADGAVNSAKIADGTVGRNDLVLNEKFHIVGAAGEPAFGNGVQGDCVWSSASVPLPELNPVGFRIDREGIVHLSGLALGDEVAGVFDEQCGATGPEPDDSGEDFTIFNLPAAYQPAKTVIVPGASGNALVISGPEGLSAGSGLTVPPGVVFHSKGSGGLTAVLDGVSYPAASAEAYPAKAPAGGSADSPVAAPDNLLGD